MELTNEEVQMIKKALLEIVKMANFAPSLYAEAAVGAAKILLEEGWY